MTGRRRACVIVVENLPVPMDRRVWQEARALSAAGWTVSVICPQTKAWPAAYEQIEGINIYRHPLPFEASGKLGFFVEYAAALFHELRLLIKVSREVGFDVIQACNPPDLIFLVTLPFKLLGKKFIFDHHDLSPELYEAKYGKRGVVHWVLRLMEYLTFRSADLIVSCNDTYRNIAIKRGKRDPGDVVTVYGIPDSERMRRVSPSPEIRAKGDIILGYVGIIGSQDGVDLLVRSIGVLVKEKGLTNIHAIVVGNGPQLPEIRQLCTDLGLDDYITFTGYLQGQALLEAFSSFDIGVIPDPPNPYNDKISMNKVFEYSRFGIPVATFYLSETVHLLSGLCEIADRPNAEGLAAACQRLIEDPQRREELARKVRQMAEARFNWDIESAKYVEVYRRLAGPAD